MPGIQKVEYSYVSSVPVAEVHSLWSTQLSILPTIVPDTIHGVQLLQGRWGKQGAVVVWKYNLQGKVSAVKDLMEVIDKKNYRVVYKVLEGGPLEHYKSFRCIFQGSPADNVVKWTLEYEKANEDVPDPTAYVDMLSSMHAKIDAHLNGS